MYVVQRQKHVDVQQQALQTLLSGNDEYSSGDVPDAKKQKGKADNGVPKVALCTLLNYPPPW